MTASRVSPPDFITSTALETALRPPLLRLALETAMNLGRGCEWTIWIAGNAPAPRIAARRVIGMGCGKAIMSHGEARRLVQTTMPACATLGQHGVHHDFLRQLRRLDAQKGSPIPERKRTPMVLDRPGMAKRARLSSHKRPATPSRANRR